MIHSIIKISADRVKLLYPIFLLYQYIYSKRDIIDMNDSRNSL